MIIHNTIVEVPNRQAQWSAICSELLDSLKLSNSTIIKISLVKSSDLALLFNVTYLEGKSFNNSFIPLNSGAVFAESRDIDCLIIPTGIGAAIGGYAGDANPVAKALAIETEYLITHPNVLNGSVMTDVPTNAIYLEGYFLDQFLLGIVNVIPNKQNNIGVIFDSGIVKERLHYEINVLNAAKSFYGCNISSYELTEHPIVVEATMNKCGFSSGNIKGIEGLLNAAEKLKESGVSAIAICCRIPDVNCNSNYVTGTGVDPIGGVESMLSHIVSSHTGLVSAHAPVLIDFEAVDYECISPISASEYIAKSFLPSVISGLRFAPKIRAVNSKVLLKENEQQVINVNNVNRIIVPYNAFGSPGILSRMTDGSFGNSILHKESSRVYLIKDNQTCLEVDIKHFPQLAFSLVDSYLDLMNCEKVKDAGIELSALRRPISRVKRISVEASLLN